MGTKSKLYQLSQNGNQAELQRMCDDKVTHVNTRTTYPLIEYVRKIRTLKEGEYTYQVECVTSNDELIIKGASIDGVFRFTFAELPWTDRNKKGYCEQLAEDKRIYKEIVNKPQLIDNYL